MTTWILVFYMGWSGFQAAAGGPAVVHNLASQAECERVAKELAKSDRWREGRCIEVSSPKGKR